MSVNSKMTALADEVRTLAGVADKLNLDEMASRTSEANTEIDGQSALIEQIKSALAGKAAGGGGGDPYEVARKMVDKSITEYIDGEITSIGQKAFQYCTKLTTVDVAKVTAISTDAFSDCSALKSVNMPLVKSISSYAFYNCSVLPNIVLPSLETGGANMFQGCNELKTIDLPKITKIVSNMLARCYRLTAVILRSETLCTLANTSAFSTCYHYHGVTNGTYNPNGDKDGYIYVPSALVDSYKAATNWSTFETQFRAIEDYPDICG